jgi:hypothetical protein
MLRAGPRHLDTRQWQAAQIFRSAYEVLEGAVGTPWILIGSEALAYLEARLHRVNCLPLNAAE